MTARTSTRVVATSRFGAVAAAGLALLLAPPPASAQTEGGPRSVIPWLDDAVEQAARGSGPLTPPPPAEPLQPPSRTAPSDATPPQTTATLDEQSFFGEGGRRDLGSDEGLVGRTFTPETGGEARREGGARTPPSETTTPAPYELTPPADGGPRSVGGPQSIEVAPITSVGAAAAGALTAEDVGLPVDAWRGSDVTSAAALVDALTPGATTAANRVAVDLLSAALEPPAGSAAAFGGGRSLLTARFDALARFGAHARVVSVAAAAGTRVLAGAGDAALLVGADQDFCRALATVLDAGSAAQRIYCGAVSGDAAGALLAIEATRAVGEGDPLTLSLLEAVAEPSLTDLITPPSAIEDLTPTRLAALRRLRMSPPPDFARRAPLSLLGAATHEDVPPRLRLEALERLEAAGAIDVETLRAAYAAASSAESGGVWGRVEAWRRAIDAQPGGFATAALFALARAEEEGRGPMMARLLAPEIARRTLAAGQAPRDAFDAPELVRALLISGEIDAAARVLDRRADLDLRAAAAILGRVGMTAVDWRAADAEPLFARAARGDARAARLVAALLAFGVPTETPGFYEAAPGISFAVDEGRSAEIAFTALASLGGDAAPSGPGLFAALSNLWAVGLDQAARRIALEAALF